MSSQRLSFRWPEVRAGGPGDGLAPLAERLGEAAHDRAATAEALVYEAAGFLREALEQEPGRLAEREVGPRLERDLAPWIAAHGWRGPCALFVDSLRAALHAAPESGTRAALGRELEAWVPGGGRLADRRAVAPAAIATLARGETVLVHGYSETVALALEGARRAGREPTALLSESAAELGGQRMARRLALAGVDVRLGYDAAVLGAVREVDRVWIGVEAIGAGAFVARVGTLHLLEEARRCEVPSAALTTSDKLVPAGRIDLPAWGDEEHWSLWPDPPAGVRLESQAFERVPIELCGAWLTEVGRERIADLCVRALRLRQEAPCLRQEAARPAGAPHAPAPARASEATDAT